MQRGGGGAGGGGGVPMLCLYPKLAGSVLQVFAGSSKSDMSKSTAASPKTDSVWPKPKALNPKPQTPNRPKAKL